MHTLIREALKRSDKGKDKGLAGSFRILLLIASGPEVLPVCRAFRTDSTLLAVMDMEFFLKVKSGILEMQGDLHYCQVMIVL